MNKKLPVLAVITCPRCRTALGYTDGTSYYDGSLTVKIDHAPLALRCLECQLIETVRPGEKYLDRVRRNGKIASSDPGV